MNEHIEDLNNYFKGWRVVDVCFYDGSYYQYRMTLKRFFKVKILLVCPRDCGLDIKQI
jgi:hypothetical protein